MNRGRAGKWVALTFAAIWVVALLLYSAMRPGLALGRELLAAAGSGNTSLVRSLMNRGASLHTRDRDGHTAVWLAAYNGHEEALSLLLARGAEADSRGQEGWTPLMWAARNGYAACVQELIRYGADVNARGNFGESAIASARSEHHEQVARILVAAGAKP